MTNASARVKYARDERGDWDDHEICCCWMIAGCEWQVWDEIELVKDRVDTPLTCPVDTGCRECCSIHGKCADKLREDVLSSTSASFRKMSYQTETWRQNLVGSCYTPALSRPHIRDRYGRQAASTAYGPVRRGPAGAIPR